MKEMDLRPSAGEKPEDSENRDVGEEEKSKKCMEKDTGNTKIQSDYWNSLFSGDLCCKLWFTVPRSSSRKLLARLTDLLRTAVVD